MVNKADADLLISEREILQGEQYGLVLNNTARAISPGLEDIMGQVFPVLDHGFVRVVDYMGNDSSIVQAARVSYGRGTKKTTQDAALINYLMKNRHTTPFEMCDIKLHVKLPIFVARQWIRHRTASVNEYSARYSILDKEFYIPDPCNLAAQSKNNNQGRDERALNPDEAMYVMNLLRDDAQRAYEHYQELLNVGEEGQAIDPNRSGIARELARLNLSLNFYTQWYWKINLHNLLHFLSLRTDSHAQYEIRAYANIILEIVKMWLPITYEAFVEYRMNAALISKKGVEVVRRMLHNMPVDQESSGMSNREWEELMHVLSLS